MDNIWTHPWNMRFPHLVLQHRRIVHLEAAQARDGDAQMSMLKFWVGENSEAKW